MLSHYAQHYEDLWRRHWWWQARRRMVAACIARLARQRPLTQILDIGCGNGLFFDELSRYGEVRGIEADPALVSPDSPWRDRIDVHPFSADYPADRRYDLILALDVLEHIPADGPAAKRIAELLNPGGFLLLTVPALRMLWSEHDVVNEHHRRYSKARLDQILVGAGLEIRALRFCFGWTVPPMLLRRVLHPGRPSKAPASPTTTTTYQVHVPARPINALLYALTRTEQTLLGWGALPVGSSLLAIGQKPAG